MTIDRTWLEVAKSATPKAFSKSVPAADLIFIDCQLKLMCPAGINTWHEWLEALYLRPIKKYLAMTSVKVVVLAFDDYTFSPLAKGPTQAKRKSRCEVPVWSPHQPLPPMIPANYASLLFNRAFKGQILYRSIPIPIHRHKPIKSHQDTFGMNQYTFGINQDTFGMNQYTFGMNQDTFGMNQHTFEMNQSTVEINQIITPPRCVCRSRHQVRDRST
jgi:hypothetical protein